MIDIPSYIYSAIKGLLIGVVLLLISLFVLPTSWVIWIIRIFKPSILKSVFAKNDKYFNDILGIILEGKFPGKYSNDSLAEIKLSKIKQLKSDLDKVESNMFTIDLLKDLFKTLSFASSQVGFSFIGETYEQIANYFSHYSSRLFDTTYRQNFSEDVIRKFEDASKKLSELEELINQGKFENMNTKVIKQQYTSDFIFFIEAERKTLENNRELIVGSIKSLIYELMELSK